MFPSIAAHHGRCGLGTPVGKRHGTSARDVDTRVNLAAGNLVDRRLVWLRAEAPRRPARN